MRMVGQEHQTGPVLGSRITSVADFKKTTLPWILPALILEITARRGGFLLGLRKPSFDLTFKGRRTPLVAVG